MFELAHTNTPETRSSIVTLPSSPQTHSTLKKLWPQLTRSELGTAAIQHALVERDNTSTVFKRSPVRPLTRSLSTPKRSLLKDVDVDHPGLDLTRFDFEQMATEEMMATLIQASNMYASGHKRYGKSLLHWLPVAKTPAVKRVMDSCYLQRALAKKVLSDFQPEQGEKTSALLLEIARIQMVISYSSTPEGSGEEPVRAFFATLRTVLTTAPHEQKQCLQEMVGNYVTNVLCLILFRLQLHGTTESVLPEEVTSNMFVMGMEAWRLIPLCMNEQSNISSKQVESLLDAVDELTFEWAERRPPNLIKTHAISPALEMARMVVKSATHIYPDLEQTPAFWTIKTNLGMLQKLMHVYRGTWSGLHVCIEPAKVTQRYTRPVNLLTGPNAAKLITGTPENKIVKVNSLLMPGSPTYSGASDDSSPQRNKAQEYLMGDIAPKTPNQAYVRSPSWRPTSAPSRVERTPISNSSMLALSEFPFHIFFSGSSGAPPVLCGSRSASRRTACALRFPRGLEAHRLCSAVRARPPGAPPVLWGSRAASRRTACALRFPRGLQAHRLCSADPARPPGAPPVLCGPRAASRRTACALRTPRGLQAHRLCSADPARPPGAPPVFRGCRAASRRTACALRFPRGLQAHRLCSAVPARPPGAPPVLCGSRAASRPTACALQFPRGLQAHRLCSAVPARPPGAPPVLCGSRSASRRTACALRFPRGLEAHRLCSAVPARPPGVPPVLCGSRAASRRTACALRFPRGLQAHRLCSAVPARPPGAPPVFRGTLAACRRTACAARFPRSLQAHRLCSADPRGLRRTACALRTPRGLQAHRLCSAVPARPPGAPPVLCGSRAASRRTACALRFPRGLEAHRLCSAVPARPPGAPPVLCGSRAASRRTACALRTPHGLQAHRLCSAVPARPPGVPPVLCGSRAASRRTACALRTPRGLQAHRLCSAVPARPPGAPPVLCGSRAASRRTACALRLPRGLQAHRLCSAVPARPPGAPPVLCGSRAASRPTACALRFPRGFEAHRLCSAVPARSPGAPPVLCGSCAASRRTACVPRFPRGLQAHRLCSAVPTRPPGAPPVFREGFTLEAGHGQRQQQQLSPGSPLGRKPSSGSQVMTQTWLSSPTSARISLENKLRRETESRGPESPSQSSIYNPHLGGKRLSPQKTSSPQRASLPQTQSPYSPQRASQLYLKSSPSNYM
ncbi:hypothetical protein CYMTET_15576 [Cymbomonas tetramitiformis]|uniref:Uncharacterized protein n=1 Tax=Cymbomonas tetramitiformis TaxID=36881 RepID=A0AAE0GDW9_9CHLO|nr:hypothetical protein CYMTET_15576 [Cymbomonas tetramitiformis]